MIENPKELTEWISNLENAEDETLNKLAKNFKYMNKNREDLRSNMDQEDLPVGEGWFKLICFYGACFGSEIYPMKNYLYEITDNEGLVKVTSDEEEAENAKKEYNVRSINIETDFDPYDRIENIENQNPIMASALEKSLSFVGEFKPVGEASEYKKAEVDNIFDKITLYSVLFGINLEKENPSSYVVYNGEGVVRASVGNPDDLDRDQEGVKVKHAEDV